VLRRYDQIMAVMLPTLRAERQATYSPVLPISPKSGRVLQVPVEVVDPEGGLIRFVDEGEQIEQSILGGRAKLQWKPDWGMRWAALDVDYEMYGKDLIDSGILGGKIAQVLGGRKPEGFVYEMFLDEHGEKISKSKGNGLSLEQWLTYGTEESLAFFAYREPKKAKQLHMGVIPRAVDEYQQFAGNYAGQPVEQQLGNPVHHIHNGPPPQSDFPLPFGLLLNLAATSGSEDPAVLWGFVSKYLDRNYEAHTAHLIPYLERVIPLAINYFKDFVAPDLRRRAPVGQEVAALRELDDALSHACHDDPQALQDIVYEIGKSHFGKDQLRDWFKALYETLLGSSQGPRMGSFIALYGIDNTRKLIAEALNRAE
jgi:lysyl-tRNA synthetase, class I